MTPDGSTPVIFLAFANDHCNATRYLRNLNDEAAAVQQKLSGLVEAGLCELIVDTDATAKEIFKTFQDARYRNRIAIFHFGGHANGYQLLLESVDGQVARVDADGIASFLGQQQGLQLVFLNGCSTQKQTEGLLNANVSAVISTSRAIDDRVATDFSTTFYGGIAGGAGLDVAFNEAASATRSMIGGNTRGAYFKSPVKENRDSGLADRWPWDLYLKKGHETVASWNVPQAAGDPLFGLPTPDLHDLPESPYRHLKWFTARDSEIFFGRGRQIRDMYERLTSPETPPIVLFYGQSGVGKSSLLDAGLFPRLQHNHTVHYVRRSESGLTETLWSTLTQKQNAPPTKGLSLSDVWLGIEKDAGRPLVIFLDQFEEVFTDPSSDQPNELDDFIEQVHAVFGGVSEQPQGKLVLGFRKEWLAEIESRLKERNLPISKVFLEPLDRQGIEEVVCGPSRPGRLLDKYSLEIEGELPEIIADDLLEDVDSPVAPTLQILLTKMWKIARNVQSEMPIFDSDLYFKLKKEGILLEDFLDQQIVRSRDTNADFVDSGGLLDLLALHTTSLGTADKKEYRELQQCYSHTGSRLLEMIRQCQDLYLLSVTESANSGEVATTTLAHDTLAPLVRRRFDESGLPGQRARRVLNNRSAEWRDAEGTPLDEADLQIVENGMSGTRVFSPAEQRLFDASQVARANRKRLRRRLWTAAATLIAGIVAAGIFGWVQRSIAVKNLAAAENAQKETEAEKHAGLLKLSDTELMLGTSSIQQEKNRILAGHHYLRARQAAIEAKDETRIFNATIAATSVFELLDGVIVHDAEISDYELSPDQSQILTLGDNTLRQWTTRPVRLKRTFHNIREARFVPNSSDFLTIDIGGEVKVWSSKNGTEQIEVVHPQIQHAQFNEDGSLMATWGEDHKARIWDMSTGSLLQALNTGPGVRGVKFYDDDAKIFLWGDGISAWDIQSGTMVYQHPVAVESANLIQDDDRILIYDRNWKFSVIDSATGKTTFDINLEWQVSGYSLSPEKTQLLIVADEVNFAILIDLATGEKVHTLKHEKELDAATEPYFLNGARFNRDGSLILTYSEDQTACLWDTKTGDLKQTINQTGAISTAIFNADETGVITVDGVDARVTDVDLENDGRLEWEREKASQEGRGLVSNEVQISQIHVLNDGRIMTLDLVNSIQFWSAEHGKPDRVVDLGEFVEDENFDEYYKCEPLQGSRLLLANDTEILDWDLVQNRKAGSFNVPFSRTTMKLNADETKLLTFNSPAKIWDVASREVLCELAAPRDSDRFNVLDGAFANDGVHVFTWKGPSLWQWEQSDGQLVRTYRFEGDIKEKGVHFTDDGSRMLVLAESSDAVLWDVKTGKELQRFGEDSTDGCQISPDGSHVLTWSGSKGTLWNSDAGSKLHQLRHVQDVFDAIFSRDGKALFTWGFDKGIRVWDVERGQIRSNLQTEGSTTFIQLNESETILLTVHLFNEREIYLWDLVSDQPILTIVNSDPKAIFPCYAGFNGNCTRILKLSVHGLLQEWSIGGSESLPEDRVIERYQLRTGTKLNAAGRTQPLTFDEWLELSAQFNTD